MAPNSPQSPGLSEMLEGLPKYRASGAPCDFVLECDGIEFPVHKAVLFSRSTYFDRMCNGDFRERVEGRAKLEDDDLENVARMLDYLYSLEYAVDTHAELDDIPTLHLTNLEGAPQPPGTGPPQPNHGVLHAQMYAMGDKYDISALKAYSLTRFRRVIATQSHLSVTDLATSITEAYETTPDSDRGLRDVVLDVAGKNVVKLTRDDAFSRMAVDIPRFGYELLQRQYREGRCAECITDFQGSEAGTGTCSRHKITISLPYISCQTRRSRQLA